MQRSAEGEDAKAIPKTVSLLVSPEQASRIALAQNLGEVSLIPRNPNDEETGLVTEITASELLGSGSLSNDRESEQNREQPQKKGPGLFDSIVGLMSKAAEERPPFEMTIVEAADVRTMQFDRLTGTPLYEDDEQRGRSYESESPTYYGGGRTELVSDPNDDADFPIEFEDED